MPRPSGEDRDESEQADDQQEDRDDLRERPQLDVLEVIAPDSEQRFPVLDHGSEHAEQAENHEADAEVERRMHGVDDLASSLEIVRFEVLVRLGNGETEADQGQRRADPRHEGPVGSRSVALLGKLVAQIHLLPVLAHRLGCFLFF